MDDDGLGAAPHGLLADYLSLDQLADELGVTERTLARWHVQRVGPPRTMIGNRVLYRRGAVVAWLATREVKPVRRRA